jgi:hypothetical protein
MSRGWERRSQHLRVCALNRASSRVEDVCCVGRRPGRDPGELAHAPFEMVALALPMERRRRQFLVRVVRGTVLPGPRPKNEGSSRKYGVKAFDLIFSIGFGHVRPNGFDFN